MVDDSHAVGFVGRPAAARRALRRDGRVDILTGTLGKALGGASGGYTAAAPRSSTAAPALAAVPVLQLARAADRRARRSRRSTCSSAAASCASGCGPTPRFRERMTKAGFDLLPGRAPDHPGDARRRRAGQPMAERCWRSGIYVIGFSFPVVPQGKARIRTQMSALRGRRRACGGRLRRGEEQNGDVIDPRRLRVLAALADHGTVTAAGQALHLTPSAVSQQLAALEAETGQELLRRRGRRVSLTGAGELLVVHANAVAAELERAQATLAQYSAGVSGRVELASFASAITQVVAPAIATLRATVPAVTVLVRDAEGHASVPLLLDGEIDVAITEEYRSAPRTDDSRLIRFPLYTEPFDLVVPAGHRLAGQPSADVADLVSEDWIAPLPGNPCRDVVTLLCDNPRITHTSDDFRAVVALVAAGAGVALVPRHARVEVPGAVAVQVSGTPPLRRVFAAVRKGSEEHPVTKAVLSALTA
jgi:DNA-binding transcriptional LysR family regulator